MLGLPTLPEQFLNIHLDNWPVVDPKGLVVIFSKIQLSTWNPPERIDHKSNS